LLDLGLVRSHLETDELTRGEGVKVLGTADYLAPEQAIDCSAVDVRADIYGLGATGYFLLTGKPPFEGDKISTKLIAHQTKPVKPVHLIRPEVPVELSHLILRMLAKSPADRFQSPAELIAALDHWAVNPPPPPTDQEVPGFGGSGGQTSSLISLGGSTPRPKSGLGPTSGSGSAIRYHSGRHPQVVPHRAGVATVGQPDQTPMPAELITLTPLPRPPKEPAKSARQATPPAVLPPVLPAAATHALKGGTGEHDLGPAAAAARRLRASTSTDTPAVRPAGRFRLRATVLAAFGLTLAVGAWEVAVLTGLVGRVAPPAPQAEPTPPAPRPGTDPLQ
jgi:serine/threonine protein kinase